MTRHVVCFLVLTLVALRTSAARAPQTSQTRTLDLGSGMTMDLVWVPGGTFQTHRGYD